MQFLIRILSVIVALAALASANSVTFQSLDGINRRIVFTASAGHPGIPSVWVGGYQTVRVEFPHGWIGNWYSVSQGRPDVPGMLGEVTFQGWNGMTYFDVSAIVNPNDHEGVQELYPAGQKQPVSGCKNWPCNNAYYMPDDIQTKTTYETDLICTLGRGGSWKRDAEPEDSESVAHSFVLGY